MLSWGSIWRSGQDPAPAPKRSTIVKTRTQHVEVIGGIASRRQRRGPTQEQLGPPRLPSELITHIVLLAALLIHNDDRGQTLELARVDRHSHRAILNYVLLPQVDLYGVAQVEAFAAQLQSNALNIQSSARRVRRLNVVRSRTYAGQRRGRSEHTSLYSDIMAAMHFEKATLAPLQTILSYCTDVRHLSLDCTARVLDARSDGEPGGLSMRPIDLSLARRNLEELDTLQSVYGGDLNEKLWESSFSPWTNLTHLQLHGPRFRMTASTAVSLSHLTKLKHIGLIMPLIVPPASTPTSLDIQDSSANALYQTAKDQLGRPSVLQLLVNLLGEQLESLLVVAHDVEDYVGNIQRVGSWVNALHQRRRRKWRRDVSRMRWEDDETRRTRVDLVTARAHTRLTGPAIDVHPTTYSKWMLERARLGLQWTFDEGEVPFRLAEADEDLVISCKRDSWEMPIEWVKERPLEDNSTRADDDMARRWLGLPEADNQVSGAFEVTTPEADGEVLGIDNLD
ncbi:hypothetical protein FA10DRAFT_266869 [Acaromyces ingoldii]|uniref:Uncharacterized protein n=1 Tax=Acaromyces ingoldii TaxID=215250 RepID=A0A316YQS5_9BASI|nr:hypothetical protein FA10DRAFT_266869 [Acaromyces ingoldii]PWN90383.1 hypothetical protein FA10DRAFT_266869 [Acaromyces ingoldii]